jgi:hypothetical protein
LNPRDLITKAAEITKEAQVLQLPENGLPTYGLLNADTVFNMAVQLLLIEANKAEAEAQEVRGPIIQAPSGPLPFPPPRRK